MTRNKIGTVNIVNLIVESLLVHRERILQKIETQLEMCI